MDGRLPLHAVECCDFGLRTLDSRLGSVELILRKLSEEATETELLDAYPRLTREDMQAAVGYAAETLARNNFI